jgi:hypothetical protein
MESSLFRYIIDTYTETLIDILHYEIYNGLVSIYRVAVDSSDKAGKPDAVLIVFQKYLKDITGWNTKKIEDETNRIKTKSVTNDYFDDLVRAVIKANIIMLTYSETISSAIAQSYYTNFSIPNFIHKCYIECAKDAHNQSFLFVHDVSPLDIKRNQLVIINNIKAGIERTIRLVLPFSSILKEFLANTSHLLPELYPKIDHTMPPQKINKQADNLDKEVKNIIIQDQKSARERVEDMIKLNKIITTLSEHVASSENEKSNIYNKHLNSYDKELLDKDYDNQSTKKSSSTYKETNIEDNLYAKKNKHKKDKQQKDKQSENLIEVFGK